MCLVPLEICYANITIHMFSNPGQHVGTVSDTNKNWLGCSTRTHRSRTQRPQEIDLLKKCSSSCLEKPQTAGRAANQSGKWQLFKMPSSEDSCKRNRAQRQDNSVQVPRFHPASNIIIPAPLPRSQRYIGGYRCVRTCWSPFMCICACGDVLHCCVVLCSTVYCT